MQDKIADRLMALKGDSLANNFNIDMWLKNRQRMSALRDNISRGKNGVNGR